jgi:SAM-dependent methyltransferase
MNSQGVPGAGVPRPGPASAADAPIAGAGTPGDQVAHYDRLLAAHYTWMLGGDHAAVAARQRDQLIRAGVGAGTGPALDLGAGPGYASVALAELGYSPVVAVDASPAMVAALVEATGPPVVPLCAAIADLPRLAGEHGPFEVIVCLGDTVPHLPSRAAVDALLTDSAAALARGGRLVLSFRDLAVDPVGTSHSLLVRSDDATLLTCVLDHLDADTLRVTDLLHTRTPDDTWSLASSSYQKLRLSPPAVHASFARFGLTPVSCTELPSGLWVLSASTPS